ncbi:MAG: fructosamine kinase family protein [Betaproteobacteria bacterium]|nr:fructosamine kinase family protein [Betaproteobacteria bacterium]
MVGAVLRSLGTGPAVATSRVVEEVSGGCIHRAFRIRGAERDLFVKWSDRSSRGMFEAEARGLEALRAAGSLRVPAVVAVAEGETCAWLALEWLDLRPLGESGCRELGERLAVMHASTASAFGWIQDNWLGTTVQENARAADWADFWRERRLLPQLRLAGAKGAAGRLLDAGFRVADALPAILAGHEPAASLLHGDLWSGNAAGTADGSPAVFDPACYHGDRETDIAMTELFGGFGRGFHEAYRSAWPMDHGYAMRRDLYNLYHVLNHFNLFGGGYGSRAEAMANRVLAAAGR